MRNDSLIWTIGTIVTFIGLCIGFLAGTWLTSRDYAKPISVTRIETAQKACSINAGLVSLNRNFWKVGKLDVLCKNNAHFSLDDEVSNDGNSK